GSPHRPRPPPQAVTTSNNNNTPHPPTRAVNNKYNNKNNNKENNTFFINYKKINSFKSIQLNKTYKLNFNKTTFNFLSGYKKADFLTNYNRLNNTVELITATNQMESVILTYNNDPCVSKVTCIEVDFNKSDKIMKTDNKINNNIINNNIMKTDKIMKTDNKINNSKINNIINNLINNMKKLINQKLKNHYITKTYNFKTKKLYLNSKLDLIETFKISRLQVLINLFDNYCLENNICKDSLNNFKTCKAEITNINYIIPNIYNNHIYNNNIYNNNVYNNNNVFYFDLSINFALYFLDLNNINSYKNKIPNYLKYNLLSFIVTVFCKQYVNLMFCEYVNSLVLNIKQLIKQNNLVYQLINYDLFVCQNNVLLIKWINCFQKLKLKVTKVFKQFVLLDEGNYLMEVFVGYEGVINNYNTSNNISITSNNNSNNNTLRRPHPPTQAVVSSNTITSNNSNNDYNNNQKTVKKHVGKIPKGFLKLYFSLPTIRNNNDFCLFNKDDNKSNLSIYNNENDNNEYNNNINSNNNINNNNEYNNNINSNNEYNNNINIIPKETYLNICKLLKKVENSKKFCIGKLLSYLELKGIKIDLFDNIRKTEVFNYIFCQCGAYKLDYMKCED
ncbi:hypothetical protein CDIK_2214, partial [Cucumispora dikerogammari]